MLKEKMFCATSWRIDLKSFSSDHHNQVTPYQGRSIAGYPRRK